MRAVKFLLAILLGTAVCACGGGSDYGGSSGGNSTGIYSISGTISGGATDHSGVTVNLAGAATKNMTTAAGGSYSFTGLGNGSYTVTPSRVGYVFTPSSSSVTVNYDNPSSINFSEAP